MGLKVTEYLRSTAKLLDLIDKFLRNTGVRAPLWDSDNWPRRPLWVGYYIEPIYDVNLAPILPRRCDQVRQSHLFVLIIDIICGIIGQVTDRVNWAVIAQLNIF